MPASFSKNSFSNSFSNGRRLITWTIQVYVEHEFVFGKIKRWTQQLYTQHEFQISKAVIAITPDDVRDVLGLTSQDIPDAKIAKMLARAKTVIQLELGKEINLQDVSASAERQAVIILAAIYAICYLTGGSAVGLSFSLGDKSVSVLKDAPPLTILQAELERILAKLKEEEPYVGMA